MSDNIEFPFRNQELITEFLEPTLYNYRGVPLVFYSSGPNNLFYIDGEDYKKVGPFKNFKELLDSVFYNFRKSESKDYTKTSSLYNLEDTAGECGLSSSKLKYLVEERIIPRPTYVNHKGKYFFSDSYIVRLSKLLKKYLSLPDERREVVDMQAFFHSKWVDAYGTQPPDIDYKILMEEKLGKIRNVESRWDKNKKGKKYYYE